VFCCGCRQRKKDQEFGVSRGLDFQNVSNIINFDFPTTVNAYIHRVGRYGSLSFNDYIYPSKHNSLDDESTLYGTGPLVLNLLIPISITPLNQKPFFTGHFAWSRVGLV